MTTQSTTTAASSSSGTTASSTSDTAFDRCMTTNGVTKPSGGPQGGGAAPADGEAPPAGGKPAAGAAGQSGQAPPGVDAAVWQKALAACRSEAGAPPAS